jgi:hypothetical protein
MITKDNIEAYLLDFAEGNLNKKDKEELILFLDNNPEYKELMNSYDSSLVLVPDESIVFSNTDALKHKSRKKVFFVAFKYSAVAIAACLLVFLFVSKLVIKPMDNENTNLNHETLVAKISPESVIETEKETIKPKTVPTEKEIKPKEEPKKEIEPKIIHSNSLVVYEVDNMVKIIEPEEKEIKLQNVIEVDNMIVFQDKKEIKKNNLLDKLKQNIENRIDKGFQSFNSSIAYFQENVRLEDGGITLYKNKIINN